MTKSGNESEPEYAALLEQAGELIVGGRLVKHVQDEPEAPADPAPDTEEAHRGE